MTSRHVLRCLLVWLTVASLLGASPALAVGQSAELRSAIDQLGDFDYAVRVEASRVIRRADPTAAVPALVEAIRHHGDSYVQFRAIVLVYGFAPPDIRSIFEEALDSSNDRVRAAAYEYFEQFPTPLVVSKLAIRLETEVSEFVRPYLVRALVANAQADDESVRARLVRDVDRGEGYFRGAVIEALGDHGAEYAVDALIRIAGEDGSLQDDALLALGKIGDGRALPALARVQDDASNALQPVVSATACLLEIDCDAQFQYVVDVLRYAAQVDDEGAPELLRGAAAGLAALAVGGRRDAVTALLEVGVNAADSARAPVALALGTVALRNPTLVISVLSEKGELMVPEPELILLRDAFDMLDEDFAEEGFYVRMRGGYWGAPAGSATRNLTEAAIRILEF